MPHLAIALALALVACRGSDAQGLVSLETMTLEVPHQHPGQPIGSVVVLVPTTPDGYQVPVSGLWVGDQVVAARAHVRDDLGSTVELVLGQRHTQIGSTPRTGIQEIAASPRSSGTSVMQTLSLSAAVDVSATTPIYLSIRLASGSSPYCEVHALELDAVRR